MPGSDLKCWPGFICLVLRQAGRVSSARQAGCSVRRGRLWAGCRAPGQPGGVPGTQTAPGTGLRGHPARPGRRCPPLWRLGRQVEPAARPAPARGCPQAPRRPASKWRRRLFPSAPLSPQPCRGWGAWHGNRAAAGCGHAKIIAISQGLLPLSPSLCVQVSLAAIYTSSCLQFEER